MLAHGVRDFIVTRLRGRPLGGVVFRSVDFQYGGQCVVIRVQGDSDSLQALEDQVLADQNGDHYWDYEIVEDSHIPRLTLFTFTISQSMRGARKGNNSDPTGTYDNKSETRSQKSSHSSQHTT